jgi:hypothetical protein
VFSGRCFFGMKDGPDQSEGMESECKRRCLALVRIRSKAEKGAVMQRMWGWKPDVSAGGFDVAFSEKEQVLLDLVVVRGGKFCVELRA